MAGAGGRGRTDHQDRGASAIRSRAGYQLPGRRGFPAQLERALKAKGLAVEVVNAGVSGDTSSGGLARLDWSVPDGTDAVILELGANDMLRGVDPKVTRKALDEIVRRLKARNIEVLLCGMLAQPNLGPDYARAFDAIYPDLAAANDLLLLSVLPRRRRRRPLAQSAPTACIRPRRASPRSSTGIMPKVEELLARVQAKPVLTPHPDLRHR